MPERKNIYVGAAHGDNPAAYRLEEILLTTHRGRAVDISDFVTDFKIIESIYTPYLRLEMNIKDNANLFEELQLSGQEMIRVSYVKEDIVIGRVSVEKSFIVADYPLFAKVGHRQQVYSIAAISELMFPAKFKTISRAVSGEIKNIIRDLLVDELSVPEDAIELTSEACTSINAIIPNMDVLESISWLLRRAYDSTGGPYYCFETLAEGFKIVSHSDIINASRSALRKYNDGLLWSKDPTEKNEMYKQRLTRILDISSDIKMSKLVMGLSGAYGANTQYVDASTKSFSQDNFNYDDEFEKMLTIDKNSTLSSTFALEGGSRRLSEYAHSSERFISLNSLALDKKMSNYHGVTRNNALNRATSYSENFGAMSQTIKIHGDPTLLPGRSIELELTQAIDPGINQEGVTHRGQHNRDEMMSGNYVISGIEHAFTAEYYCTVVCKRDSLSYEL